MALLNQNWSGNFETTIRQMKRRMSFGEKGKEKESVGANHARLFCVNNRTTEKFRPRKSVKLYGLGEKPTERVIFDAK